tara:strand:- start:1353 stop:1826 length:474 start_codon:yes stop_codon:yes gene_type:complete
MSNWEKWTKKYVWDDEKTPFFISVEKLTKLQAKKELFLYLLFVGTPFGLIGFMSLAGMTRGEHLGYLLLLFYSVTVLISLYFISGTKSSYAAVYSATAPLVLFFFLLIDGFPPKLHEVGQSALIIFLLLWLRYTIRIIRICRRFPDMREGVATPPTW